MMKHLHSAALLLGLAIPATLVAQAAPEPAPSGETVVPLPDWVLPLKHTPERTTGAITARDLMTRLYIFADDSMMGRESGTPGNVRGTDYIASEMKRLHLVPAGDSGTYFQTIPLKTRGVDSGSTLAAGGQPLAYGSEWAGRAADSFSDSSLAAVYGGKLGDSMPILADSQVAGKLVVYLMPAGPAGMQAARRAARLTPSAAGLALVTPPFLLGYFVRPATFVDDPATRPAGAPSQRPAFLFTREGALKLFDAPLEQLAPGAAGKTVSVDLRMMVKPVPFPSRNVVAILPGRDPKLRGEYVAIGAHNDHIGLSRIPVDHDSLRIFDHLVRPGGAEDQSRQATPEQQAQVNAALAAWRAKHGGAARPDSIANGADDDGSGSVSALEIAENLASLKQRPRRSVLFVWHAGEEKGLLGSAYFTDHPTVPRDSIVAQLNMDMVGRGDAWDVTGLSKDGAVLHGNPNYLQIVGSRRLSTELGDLIEKVNTEDRHGLLFDYSMDANGHPMNIYCRSDHYEYARYGIPIAFFTTGGHSDYHQVTDEPEYIDYEHMARVDRLVADVALHLANLDHRVVVDQPKPDPQGACQQ